MMFRTQAGDAASGQLDDSSPIGRPPPPTHPPPPWDLLAVGPRPPRWTPIEDLITCSQWWTGCLQEMSVSKFSFDSNCQAYLITHNEPIFDIFTTTLSHSQKTLGRLTRKEGWICVKQQQVKEWSSIFGRKWMAFLINGEKGPVSFLTNGKKGPMVFQLNGKKGPNAFQCFWLLSFQNRNGGPVRSKQANQPQEKRGSISRTHWEVGLPWGRQVVVIFFSSTFTFLIFAFFLLFKRWTTRRDQERELIGPASLLKSWRRVFTSGRNMQWHSLDMSWWM